MALTGLSIRTRLPWWRPTVGTLTPHHEASLRVAELWSQPDDSSGDDCPLSFTVVTPSFNQARFLTAALASVRRQKYRRVEHIVVDGGSSDGSGEVIKENSSGIAWWISEADRGQADALNKGFRRATGDVLCYLNADDCLLPGCLKRVASFFDARPDIDVVYGNRVLIDEDDRLIGSWILPEHSLAAFSWIDFVPQETMFWRRRIWDRAGGQLDESLEFCLDWDLIHRFHRSGAKFARLPVFLAAFRVHPAQKTHRMAVERAKWETGRLLRAMHNREVGRLERILRSLPFLVRQRFEEVRRASDYSCLLRGEPRWR